MSLYITRIMQRLIFISVATCRQRSVVTHTSNSGTIVCKHFRPTPDMPAPAREADCFTGAAGKITGSVVGRALHPEKLLGTQSPLDYSLGQRHVTCRMSLL